MPAGGTFARRLVLNHIPVFDHHAVIKAQDIDHDPVRRLAEASEATVQHDEVVFSDCQLAFVTQIAE